MAVKLPTTTITFTQLSTTAIERSERGIAALIVKDDTDNTISYVRFKNAAEVDEVKAKFTSQNLKYIKDVFTSGVYELLVIRMSTDTTLGKSDPETVKTTLNTALEVLLTITKNGWVTIADGTTEQFTSLVSWVKDKSQKGYSYKCVVYQVDSVDHMNVVNFYNSKIEFNDERKEQTGLCYLASLIGIFASCNVTRSTTYYTCPNLAGCSTVGEEDTSTWLDKGRLFLILDEDKVKIASGINTLTTLNGSTLTEDMRYIETVEVMNLISDDIREVFKSKYVGKLKNSYINQMLFINSINAYLKDLAGKSILDNEYENIVEVDTDSQKLALQSIGKDVEGMSEQELKLTTYKRSMFLKGDIKILNCMENLELNINLY